jgi:hypothetical protein
MNPRTDLITTRKIVDRAWTLFRKRQMFVDLIRGGSKSEEFTLSANGFHYHLHCIWLSRFLLFQEVRRVWTECVVKAFIEFGVVIPKPVINAQASLDESGNLIERKGPFDTKDGLLKVVIKPIGSWEGAIQECAKYVTKSDSWTKIDAATLADVGLVRRWFRMFELFGSFKVASKLQDVEEFDDASDAATVGESRDRSGNIVHTRSLSDGGDQPPSHYWRDKLLVMSLETYVEHLESEIARSIEARIYQLTRRWPDATLQSLANLL